VQVALEVPIDERHLCEFSLYWNPLLGI
jgi:hypothetical protein